MMSMKGTNLNSFGCLQRLLRRNPHLTLPQQLLNEVGDVSPGDRDVFDAAADNVAFSLRSRCEAHLEAEGAEMTKEVVRRRLPPG